MDEAIETDADILEPLRARKLRGGITNVTAKQVEHRLSHCMGCLRALRSPAAGAVDFGVSTVLRTGGRRSGGQAAAEPNPDDYEGMGSFARRTGLGLVGGSGHWSRTETSGPMTVAATWGLGPAVSPQTSIRS